MSRKTTRTIACDVPCCDKKLLVNRRREVESDWGFENGKDYCPSHWDAMHKTPADKFKRIRALLEQDRYGEGKNESPSFYHGMDCFAAKVREILDR